MFAALDTYAHQIIEFVREHNTWAPLVVFWLAFGESLAFLSLIIPAWAALVGIGALIGVAGLDFTSILFAAAIGAALGDWLSYWIGQRFKGTIAHIWPLSRHPGLLPKGHGFVEKYGVLAIFIGRFFGPLRASVPLVAGILEMPWLAFQIANFVSAFVWAALLLAPGMFGVKLLF
jgi:membrane protein DedA with SNARE-associated domain